MFTRSKLPITLSIVSNKLFQSLCSMYKALVLVTSLAQADEFQRHLVGASYSDVQFKYPPGIVKGEQTPADLLKDCRELLGDEHLDAVVNIFPGLELVQTALVADHPHLRCTNFESAFVCGHRYYSRQMAMQGFNCRFGLLHLADHSEESIGTLFEEIGCPLNISDNIRLGKLPFRQIRTMKQFYRQLPAIKAAAEKTLELTKPLMKGNIPYHKYPLGIQLNCIVEEAFDPKEDPFSTHYVEGCVMDGDVTPWVISDVITWLERPHCVKGIGLPTQLDEAAQFQLWAVFREVLDNLQHLKFDNQFLTIKVNIHPAGKVRVLDMYACVLRDSPILYRHVYQNGDNIRAQIKIATGQMLSHPKSLGGRFAMRAYLTTFKQGRASELVNYKAFKELPKGNPQLHGLPPEDAMIDPDVLNGFQLAEVNILGSSYKDCCHQMRELTHKIMKVTDDCPWATKG